MLNLDCFKFSHGSANSGQPVQSAHTALSYISDMLLLVGSISLKVANYNVDSKI